MLKKELRLKYKALRKALSENDIESMSLEIANQALSLPIWDKTYFHIFLPIEPQKEINTEYLLHILAGKDKEIILPAYNDSQGITAEFNLNLLDRINKELGADFNRDYFIHAPVYDEEMGIAKSYIKSLVKQSVRLGDHQFNFEKDELIHTEVSRKYDDQVVKQNLVFHSPHCRALTGVS